MQSRIFGMSRAVVPEPEAANLVRIRVLRVKSVVACTAALMVLARQRGIKTLGSMAADRVPLLITEGT